MFKHALMVGLVFALVSPSGRAEGVATNQTITVTLPSLPESFDGQDWVLAIDGKTGQLKWKRDQFSSPTNAARRPFRSVPSIVQTNKPSNKVQAIIAVGETQEDIIKKLGEPNGWIDKDSNLPKASFYNVEPSHFISFYKDKEGRAIAGSILYRFPADLDQKMKTEMLQKLLDVNAAGQPWTTNTNFPGHYEREGAKINADMTSVVSVTLEAYRVYDREEKNRLAGQVGVSLKEKENPIAKP